jgi:FAD/FMN-containing dehydrogenase
MHIAMEEASRYSPRGAGTSQCGQTVGAALVIDDSRYVNRVLEVDVAARRAVVEPGVVLDTLNAQLRAHASGTRSTSRPRRRRPLGGMSGNNSCGSRSLAYGNMVDRVNAIDAWLPTGIRGRFDASPTDARIIELAARAAALFAREKDEIAARFPDVARNVAGYNLNRLPNLASLLVGSEGTLAWFERIHIRLAPLPKHKALGVAHFPRFYDAMDAAQHIVKLGPSAVELVDRTMLDLALANAAFAPVIRAFVKGEPKAILLVEFAGDDGDAGCRRERLSELMGDLGFAMPWSRSSTRPAEVAVGGAQGGPQHHDVDEGRRQTRVLHRGLRGAARAPRRVHLAAHRRLPQARHRGHLVRARLGGLPARAPGAQHEGRRRVRMRAIAEEAAELVRRYKGSYSGEHGDGLCAPSGSRLLRPAPHRGARLRSSRGSTRGPHEPGKIREPAQAGRPPLHALRPSLQAARRPRTFSTGATGAASRRGRDVQPTTGIAASSTPGPCARAIEHRRSERDLTRGRANTLRLALSNQLGGGRGAGGGGARGARPCASRARAASASARPAWTWRA